MLRRWARLAVFFATFATLWLVASPARASGPLCDDRGATAVAPSPALIHPEQSLLALEDDDCDRDAQLPAWQRHRAPGERIVIADGDVAQPVTSVRVYAAPVTTVRMYGALEHPRPGVRDRLDRPPRG
jgi:hypothetical protein